MRVEFVHIEDGDYLHTFKLFHIEIDGTEYCVAEERLNDFIEQQIEEECYSLVEEIDDRYEYYVPQEIADTQNENEIIKSIKDVIQ